MGKINNSPNFQDMKNHGTYTGIVGYRNQAFRYIFSHKGSSLSLFIFDPQTDGMTLTNACDFVIEMICKDLLDKYLVSKPVLQDLFSAGLVSLRDSNGDWSSVKVKITEALNIKGEYVITGAVVGGWKHLDITPEYLELFKLLG